MDGRICNIGGKTLDQEGYDLLGLICGSEGLLGVITEVTVKILKKPQTARAILIGFSTLEDGGNCVSEIISTGIVPSGMEIMDKALIEATDNFCKAGYPRDAEALMIVELDGTNSEVDELINKVSDIAKKNNFNHVLIDTAGRLQNKRNLMDEYKKIANVAKKIDDKAPHEVILILDATTGQNILNQVEEFNKIIPITGLIMTKLDSTAKGGILIAVANKYKLPIIALGLGEKEDDLQIFDAEKFANAFIKTN